MIALVIFFLFVGLDRVVAAQRWPAIDPFRTQWRRWIPRIKGFIKSAPATFAYLFILVITTWVLQTSSSKIADQLLLERSTNLHQLAKDPVRVLFGSAFWVSDTGELLFALLAYSVLVASVERWIGSARTVSVFFFGHVGATLIVAFWIWASLNFAVIRSPLTSARDVGSSYGLAALTGILSYKLSGPIRWFFIVGAVSVVGVSLYLDPGYTDWGHAFALAIGFCAYWIIPRRMRMEL